MIDSTGNAADRRHALAPSLMARIGAATMLLACAQTAGAQAADPNPEDDWQFIAAPLYIWFAGIEGSSTIGPETAALDVKFKDALSNLEGIFTIHGEAHKGRVGLFTDFMYLDLGPETTGPAGGNIDVDVTNAIWELGGAYRFGDGATRFEVVGGMRYFNLSLSVSSFGPNIKVREGWFDGFGGGRLSFRFGKEQKWRLSLRGDVGAGGSDLSWGAVGLVSYRHKKWLAIDAGYKALGVDYKTGGAQDPKRFAYDVVYHGPIAGLELRW